MAVAVSLRPNSRSFTSCSRCKERQAIQQCRRYHKSGSAWKESRCNSQAAGVSCKSMQTRSRQYMACCSRPSGANRKTPCLQHAGCSPKRVASDQRCHLPVRLLLTAHRPPRIRRDRSKNGLLLNHITTEVGVFQKLQGSLTGRQQTQQPTSTLCTAGWSLVSYFSRMSSASSEPFLYTGLSVRLTRRSFAKMGWCPNFSYRSFIILSVHVSGFCTCANAVAPS